MYDKRYTYFYQFGIELHCGLCFYKFVNGSYKLEFPKGGITMKFQVPQMEIVRFSVQDVIATSFELSDKPIEDFMQDANIPIGGFPSKGGND